MKWKTLIHSLVRTPLKNDSNPTIKSLHMDSREVKPGGLFFCVRGYTVDGHDYVDQAIENGASAIVSEMELAQDVPTLVVKDTRRAMAKISTLFYGRPSEAMKIIGVTGTNGKTTVTHIIEDILNKNDEMTGLIGTMYTKIGSQKKETKNTTPDSLLLQRTFKEMEESKVDTVIMEVSSHALQSGRVRGTDFDIAIFTNLSPEHLDFHKTMDEYKHAKGLLFSQLGNTYQGKYAILNADDPVSEYYEEITIADVITYGITNDADIQATNLEITPEKTSFDVKIFDETLKISSRLIGKFNVYNILASIAACYTYGVPLNIIQKSINEIKGISGRFETVDVDSPFTVIVDYAHTPDSLSNILATANELKKGNLIVVVGTGGDRDRTKRPKMAEIATDLADFTVLTSDNPRSEDPQSIIDDMEKGVVSTDYTAIVDRKKAIEYAVTHAEKDDLIIIAGKGHETYQILADKTIDFDDKAITVELIDHHKLNTQ